MKAKFEKILFILALLLNIFLTAIHGIRIYEGTNLDAPKQKPHKTTDASKKSLYISKRSWNSEDDFKNKQDSRSVDPTKRKTENSLASLYKISFKEQEFAEYIKYTKQVPRLEEYTFCMWYKPKNMTHDHTLFTYALNRDEKLLRFSLSVSDKSLRMAIRESPVYDVPVKIRQGRWYHICQSWHGVLGEWQVFLNGRKIGAGVLPLYKETYIPEGGEVILSQDLTDKRKDHNNGLEGELFGFNLVDEAVPGEQALFINMQYKPDTRTFVPPFKKLPPTMKKTYQEIKAYISKLPSPADAAKSIDFKHYPSDQGTGIKRTRDSLTHYKRYKTPPRLTHPPVRKVVYYREDRKFPLESRLNHDGYVKSTKSTNTANNQHEDNITLEQKAAAVATNHSAEKFTHNYRIGKTIQAGSNYEIYEKLDEDFPPSEKTDHEENGGKREIERKARANFDLHMAREANKVYTLSSLVRDSKKTLYHFETGEGDVYRVAESKKPAETSSTKREKTDRGGRKFWDSIPVHEPEVLLQREKRQAANQEEPLAEGFRRLPRIPDSFIDLFAKDTPKKEIQEKLEEFFPQNQSLSAPAEQRKEDDYILTAESAPSDSPLELSSIDGGRHLQQQHPATEVPMLPAGIALPEVIPSSEVKEFDPRHRIEDRISSDWTMADRRKFDVTSGTDLIMRSYGLCTADGGSPIQNKKHLIISWAETPIRIFGGAEVENARNECGNF